MATIVLADDSPTLRRVVASVLTGAGHEVVQAEDGIGAVAAVLATQPDAVVLDVQLPRLSGFLVTRVLKHDWRTADIPVVALTSLDAASDRWWATQSGVDRFLSKDTEPPALAAAVAEVVDAADGARGGRPRPRPEAAELSEQEVLSRACDLLDRTLLETSVAQSVLSIAVTTQGLESCVAALLGVLQRLVAFDLAAVLLTDERTAYVAVGRPTARTHYDQFLTASAESLDAGAGHGPDAAGLTTRVAQAGGVLLDDPEDLPGGHGDGSMATYLSMPLRGPGGAVAGVLALSSGAAGAFGEAVLTTLGLLEQPAVLVLDAARRAGVRAHA